MNKADSNGVHELGRATDLGSALSTTLTPVRSQKLGIAGIKHIRRRKYLASLWAPNLALHVTNLQLQIKQLSDKLDLDTCITPEAKNCCRISPQTLINRFGSIHGWKAISKNWIWLSRAASSIYLFC